MKPCELCEFSERHPKPGMVAGAVDFRCLGCCTRLVLSAHPSREQAAAMLATIARFQGAPGRAEVLASVRQAIAKRH
jgi:hypothetical protein